MTAGLLVVGLPGLGAALEGVSGRPVREAPPGWSLPELAGVASGSAGVVAAGPLDGDATATAVQLVGGGVPVVVVNDPDHPWSHPDLATLTPPFAAEDLVSVLALPDPPSGPPGPAFPLDDVVVPAAGGAVSAWPAAPSPASPDEGGEVPPWLVDGFDPWHPSLQDPDDDPAPPSWRSEDPDGVGIGDHWAPVPAWADGLRPGDPGWPPPGADDRPSPRLHGTPPGGDRSSPHAQCPSPRHDRRAGGRPTVLAWTCPKGGSGKTSLSLRYAAFLAGATRRQPRVVWLDANLQQADGARYLGADERSARTVLDLAGGPEPSERAVLDVLTPPEETGWPMWTAFGPALKADADPRVITSGLYRRVVDILRGHFDHVVVDTPVAEHHNAFFTDFVLPEADQVVVVVPPLLPVVRAVREWLELQCSPVAVGGVALPPAAVRVVLNMADASNGCPVEAVRDAWLAAWTWAGEVPLDPAWTAATNHGGLVDDGSRLAAGFAELVRATTGDIAEGGGQGQRRWRQALAGVLGRRPGR